MMENLERKEAGKIGRERRSERRRARRRKAPRPPRLVPIRARVKLLSVIPVARTRAHVQI